MTRRLLALLVTMLAILIGALQPGVAVATCVVVPATHTCDGHRHAAAHTATALERGPPAANERFATENAVDEVPHGALAWTDGETSSESYDNDLRAAGARGLAC